VLCVRSLHDHSFTSSPKRTSAEKRTLLSEPYIGEFSTNLRPSQNRTINDEGANETIERIITLQGQEIEMCGWWVWVGGQTRMHREELKVEIPGLADGKNCLSRGVSIQQGILGRSRDQPVDRIRHPFVSHTFRTAPRCKFVAQWLESCGHRFDPYFLATARNPNQMVVDYFDAVRIVFSVLIPTQILPQQRRRAASWGCPER
jgi:hypothetical protein